MPKRRPKTGMLTDDKRKACVQQIITFFGENRDEEIGVIAAGEILDVVLELTAVDIYYKGIVDSKNLLKERFEDLSVDLDLLLQ
jgi:uncharacterized protein (DUF2164 family)